MFSNFCPVCKHKTVEYKGNVKHCTYCKGFERKLPLWQRPILWTVDKSAWVRMPALMFFAYTTYRYLTDYNYPMMRINNAVNAINFGIHELGHILFIPFGTLLTYMGGSVFQCVFPLLWLGACIWKKWYFAATMCLVWFGLNFYDVATYVADARDRILPLATMSDDYDSAHDWYNILRELGRLEQDKIIAGNLRFIGAIFIFTGLATGAVLLLLMIFKPFKPEAVEEVKPTPEMSSIYPNVS